MGPHASPLRGSLPPEGADPAWGGPAPDHLARCRPMLRGSLHSHAPSRRVFGFTLIELLVALAIMAMLALLSWRSIDGMNHTQTLTQQRADELLRLQAALGQWTADLDALVDTEELNPLDFDGRVLRLTRRDAAEGGLSSEGVRVVAWTRMQRGDTATAQWVRWQSSPVSRRNGLADAWQRAAKWAESGTTTRAADQRDSAVTLAAIDQWQLFYHRGETWGNPLSSVGTESPGSAPAGTDDLPNAVRLVLTLSAGQGLSGDISSDWVRPTLVTGRTGS
jgi:general secretion pathway protein J